MDPRALEYVAPHCDLMQRLADVPADARVRGIAFRSITAALQECDRLAAYSARFGPLRYESMALYPLAEYLLRLASAGAALFSPAELYLGVGEIMRRNAREMTASVLGQTLIHALASEPRSLLEQGLAMRRQTFCYGSWELVHHAPRHLEVRYSDEYVWIEQAISFAALGTFEDCRIQPRMQLTMAGRYDGSHTYEW